jgi:hypothetical protein
MLTPPLPIPLKNAEIRLAGNILAVSAHGITIQTQLGEPRAAALWAQLGVRPSQVSITVRCAEAGVELVRLNQRRCGLRIWVGAVSIYTPVWTKYWLRLRTGELAGEKELAYA